MPAVSLKAGVGGSRGRVEAVWMVDAWRARKAEELTVEGEGGGFSVRPRSGGRVDWHMLKTVVYSMIWKLQVPKFRP